MKKILCASSIILMSVLSPVYAGQCAANNPTAQQPLADGVYEAVYTNFVGPCPIAFNDSNPLVLKYEVKDGYVTWTKIVAPANATLANKDPVKFCAEGIDHEWDYMSTETGHIAIKHEHGIVMAAVTQLAVEFNKESKKSMQFYLKSSGGYMGEEKRCLFFTKRAYQEYLANHKSEKPL